MPPVNRTWHGTDVGNEGDWNTAANWTPAAVPVATDHVSIPPGSNNITSGLDQSGVALGNFRVEDGYAGVIGNTTGTSVTYLILDCDSFFYGGIGTGYFDLQHAAATVDATILSSAAAAVGKYSINLKGDDLDDLPVRGGTVGIATVLGDSMIVDRLRITGTSANVTCGIGSTASAIDQYAGSLLSESGNTTATIEQSGGTCRIRGAGTISSAIINAGTFYPDAWATFTALTINGGTVDGTQGGASRTITDFYHNGGTLIWDPDLITFANKNNPSQSGPKRIVVSDF